MAGQKLKYEDKFVAFVDILGFKAIVEKSAKEDDPESVARMIGRLGSEDDTALYREYGAEICPESEKRSADLAMRISQVSDCVVVSAELSPAGAINIVNYCRKIAERLLLRERVLCKGYVTRGKIVHDKTMFFGPGYQAAVDGEKTAAAIEWPDGVLGTPFIEIDPEVVSYLETYGDDCTRKMFSRMTDFDGKYTIISPYRIFDRFADWAFDPSKSADQVRKELNSGREIIAQIKSKLADSKPIDPRGQAKLVISFAELSKARDSLIKLEDRLAKFSQPFSAR